MLRKISPLPALSVAGFVLILFTLVAVSKPHTRFADVDSTVATGALRGSQANVGKGQDYDDAKQYVMPEETVHYRGKTHYSLSEKPPVKVVALVFAGRKNHMRSMECYLRRNLVAQGGWLDEAQWMVNTKNEEDYAFIENVVAQVPEYSMRNVTTYQEPYNSLDPETIYVKIDDDVVFFEDHTVAALVTRVYNNPQFSIVSANMMNQGSLAWVHMHLDALHPYLPEAQAPEGYDPTNEVTDWRLSSQPKWEGEINAQEMELKFANEYYYGSRWLRVPGEHKLLLTPLGQLQGGSNYAPFNIAIGSWPMAAQQQYSFFENLENNELWRYKFDVWNYWYERLSINFIAFQGKLIIDNPVPHNDDEGYLSVELPFKLKRPAIIDGSAVAAHFAYGPASAAVNKTDLSGRYARFAEENVCGKPLGSPWKLGRNVL